MNRTPRKRRVLVVGVVLALLTMPLAGAFPLERPHTTERHSAGWFAAAADWLASLTIPRRPATDHRHQSNSRTLSKAGTSTSGGSCIDPAGKPIPLCPDVD